MTFVRKWGSRLLRNSGNSGVSDDAKHEDSSPDFEQHHTRLADMFSDIGNSIRPWLPPVNFITIHWTYFILISLFASVIFWGSSNPAQSIGYWDSLFLTVSALTSAGLNSLNLSSE